MMRKLRFISLFLVLSSGYAWAQCCPYIDQVSVVPTNPTTSDPVKIVTVTTTPNWGSKIYYNILKVSDTFHITACFWEGMLTVLKTFYDTTDVGLLPPGTYFIHYLAYSSWSMTDCQENDSNALTTTFSVALASSLDEAVHNVKSPHLFPNPTAGLLYVQNNTLQPVSIQLFNRFGRLIFAATVAGPMATFDLTALPDGIYYYVFPDGSGSGSIVKQ